MTIQKYFLVIPRFRVPSEDNVLYQFFSFSPDFYWLFGTQPLHWRDSTQINLPLPGGRFIACRSSLGPSFPNPMNQGIVETSTEAHIAFVLSWDNYPLASSTTLIWPPSYQSLKPPVYQGPLREKHSMHWAWLDMTGVWLFLTYNYRHQKCMDP